MATVTAYGHDYHPFQVGSCLSTWHMQNLVNAFTHCVHRGDLPGCVAEFGVFAGETSRELARYLDRHGMARTLYLFDTFQGLPEPTAGKEGPSGRGHYYCYKDGVIANMDGLMNYRLMPGLFADYLESFREPICFAHINPDLYAGVRDAVAICARLMPSGGRIVIDDYDTHGVGVTHACQEFVLDTPAWRIHVQRQGQLVSEKT